MPYIRDPNHFKGWTTERFISELNAVRAAHPYGTHPVIGAIERGQLSRADLQTFLTQWWYLAAVGSEQVFPTILARMPIDHRLYPIKKNIVENIHGEFFVPDIHPEVNVDMIASGLGVSREAVYGAPILPETIQMATTLLHVAESSWEEGLAALVWGIEAQSPIQFERQGPALREKYGFKDTRYPDMHVQMDKEHASSAEDFIRMIATKDSYLRLWNAAVSAIEGMNMWHDRMYERFSRAPRAHAA